LVTALIDSGDAETSRVIVHAPAGTDLPAGSRIGLELPPERTYFFDADTGNARPSRERVRL
jgi:sn-glycerol 3-phosphate transport system ATP-binding protein